MRPLGLVALLVVASCNREVTECTTPAQTVGDPCIVNACCLYEKPDAPQPLECWYVLDNGKEVSCGSFICSTEDSLAAIAECDQGDDDDDESAR